MIPLFDMGLLNAIAQQEAILHGVMEAAAAQKRAHAHPSPMGDIIDVEAVDITDQVRLTYEGNRR